MRISTWNVNGYRAVWAKGFLDWVQTTDPDVLCLQEIKVKKEQLTPAQTDLPGRTGHWNPAIRPGYSGVASFFKIPPVRVEYGIGEPAFDCEGRVIQAHFPGFILFNVYFPSGQSGRDRIDYKLAFYARLLEYCDRLQAEGNQVVITGDFNTAHTEIDLANPRQNQKTSGFLPEERAWIDTYLQHGLVDVYRTRYPSRVEYTWWTFRSGARDRNIGWRLDYFLISSGLVDRVKDVVIHKDTLGSDHCPVTLDIDG